VHPKRLHNLVLVSNRYQKAFNLKILAISKALSTPAVRHLAKKHNLDINLIIGTGRNGRVTKGDVILYMEAQKSPAT